MTDTLTRWTTDPDHPHKPRIYPNPLPAHILSQLTHLSRTVAPLLLITIDLSADTETITPL